jgi:hypothetical protein
MQETTRNLLRFLAGRARRECSRVVAQIAVRRRLAVVCSAALTAGLAVATVTAVSAAPASAAISSGFCLDANAQETYNFGAISQWDCNQYDQYQSWSLSPMATSTPYGTTYMIFNDGAYNLKHAEECLDANAQQVYDFGGIMQFACNYQDPYQQWILEGVGNGWYELMNYGDILIDGTAMCLDAVYGQQFTGGSIIQYACDINDSYQQWGFYPSIFGAHGIPGHQLALNYDGNPDNGG